MTIDINFPHKEFELDRVSLEKWLRSNAGPSYAGLSVDYDFSIHFTSEPAQNIKDAIQSYWDSIDNSVESVKISHAARLDRAVAAARVGLPYTNWDSMIAAERKLVMGQMLADEDREALLQKYPQV